MQKKLFLIILLFLNIRSLAQSHLKKENNVWIATYDYQLPPNTGTIFPALGIDFNTVPPSGLDAAAPISQYVLAHPTGMASISDKNGNLLFYSDGNIVWNRNHDVMENGWGINDNNVPPFHLVSTSYWGGVASSFNRDGVVIVPVPGSSHKYYIFSVVFVLVPEADGSYWNNYGVWEGKLRYSVVDMEKDGGLGDVELNNRGIVMADSMSGNLQVVTGEDCNYWLVGNFLTGGFRSFNITAAGVDTNAVVSTVTLPLSSTIWELNISPDRSQLAEAFSEEVQLCHFDAATGVVSDYSPAPVLLGTQNTLSVAFSPNSSKLYLGGLIGIRQYDVSGPVPVFNYPPLWLDTTVFEFYGPLRLGPDNKIYFNYYAYPANTYSGWAIQDPDETGAACDIDSIANAPLLMKRLGGGSEFPNEVAVIIYDTATRTIKAPICFNDSSVLLQPLPVPDTGTDYHWKFKNGVNYVATGTDTAALNVTLPGIYAVQYFTAAPCTFHQDTFLVDRVTFSVSLLRNDPQLVSCDGQPIILDPYTDAKTPAYQWQDSSTGATLAADTSGMYKVAVSSEGCTAADSIHVFITDVRQSLREDTVLCVERPEQSVLLQASVSQGASVLWSTGSTDAIIYVVDSGWYAVTVTDSSCVGTDSFHLDREFCECPVLFPTAFSPNGDGRNDYYWPSIPDNCSITAYKLDIYNRWGQHIYVGYGGDKGWDGSYSGLPADVGVYMYRLQMTVGLERETIIKNGDFILLR